MMQRVSQRKKRSIAEKLSVKRRNALARNLVGHRVTIKTIGRVVETDHDRGLPPGEGRVTRTGAAGRLPVTTRSAVIG